jgi:hypothetical protein
MFTFSSKQSFIRHAGKNSVATRQFDGALREAKQAFLYNFCFEKVCPVSG